MNMKTLYLDIFSGISGDMFIGALIDLGVDVDQLEHELKNFRWTAIICTSPAPKIAHHGVKFDVHLRGRAPHEHETTIITNNPFACSAHAHEHEHSHPHSMSMLTTQAS